MEFEDTDSPAVEKTRSKRKHSEQPGSVEVWLGSVKIPSMANFVFLFIVSCGFMYKGLTSGLFYLIFRLVFGTLYPAYASYKAVRTKNVKEYVKWMMYWIVFALFSCAETFTDVFLSWFPFYYEIKIILVLWLLSPATKGSSILYRKFVHPTLSKREQEIDEYISKAKEQGYHTVLNLGTKGVNYATNVIMQTAIKNLNLPGAIEPPQMTASTSAPSISTIGKDRVDGEVKMEIRSISENELYYEMSDDEADLFFANVEAATATASTSSKALKAVKKEPKNAKPRARRSTRKTAKNNDYNEFSD